MLKLQKKTSGFFRKSLILLLVVLGGLALVLTINTMMFSSRQIEVAPATPQSAAPGAIERLSAAVQIPTVSYPDRIDTLAFRRLDSLTRKQYPLIDSLLERLDVNPFSQVFRWPGKEAALKPVLLLAHLDVVPVETEALGQWTHPPFSGDVADGFLWGRGTLDDKISAFAILEAVEQLLAQGFTPNRNIYLAFGHDEEVSGYAGAQSIAAYFSRQGLHFEYVLDEGHIILKNALAGLDPPLAMIGIAEKGYLTLQLKVQLAQGGHSSMPPAETAIGILAQAIDRLQDHPFPGHIDGASKALFNFIGPEMHPLYKTLFANLWLTRPLLISQLSKGNASNAILRTTIAPTIIQGGVRANVLPSQAQAQINFRIIPGETVESVTEYVRNTIADERVRVGPLADSGSQDPSPVSGTDTFGFNVIQKSIREIFPEVVVAPALVIAATDSRHYQAISDQIYRFQPLYLEQEDLSRIHGIDERISVEGYGKAIEFYRQLLLNSSL